MAYSEKKLRALGLRKIGMSYSQIKRELKVSKSTLSLWLRHLPLTEKRIRELSYDNEQRIERFRDTFRKKREKRLLVMYEKEKARLLPLSDKELYIAGLMLYWGEGGKTARGQITLSNSNPRVIIFWLKWLYQALNIKKPQVKIKLHLYMDMDFQGELRYWSRMLRLSEINFTRPYIKMTTLRGLTYKSLGHGTCNVIVYGTKYYERVMMGIEALVGKNGKIGTGL